MADNNIKLLLQIILTFQNEGQAQQPKTRSAPVDGATEPPDDLTTSDRLTVLVYSSDRPYRRFQTHAPTPPRVSLLHATIPTIRLQTHYSICKPDAQQLF